MDLYTNVMYMYTFLHMNIDIINSVYKVMYFLNIYTI